MVKALINILPGMKVEVELTANVGEVAGQIGKNNGHADYDVNVVFVELEEATEGLDTPPFFV